MTLLDYPGKVACTVFLQGCNFRCPFCHNALLVTKQNENEISAEAVIDYLSRIPADLSVYYTSGAASFSRGASSTDLIAQRAMCIGVFCAPIAITT